MEGEGSWLFRDTDRERLLDMDRRLQPPRRAAFAVLGVALLACGPWLGWWTLLALAVAAALFALADTRMERSAHPEYLIFSAWVGSEVIMAVSVALSGGPSIPTMAWFAIPVVTLSARFSTRGIALGVAIALGLMIAVGFVVDAGAVIDNPTLVIAPAALILAVALLSSALMRSDVDHRAEAVIDPLTGMLNRKALGARNQELSQQSAVSGEPIGVVVVDLDHFKAVNDALGHAQGDAVLRDVAYALRNVLRAFDLVYRIGGEEFLVLVPGADAGQAAELAEQLRAAVASTTVGDDQRLTISAGVAASGRGSTFDYDTVFARADAALYEAKRAGRDCVRRHGEAEPALV
jgi:diguanylate cyclase (GGDEF)-like protein